MTFKLHRFLVGLISLPVSCVVGSFYFFVGNWFLMSSSLAVWLVDPCLAAPHHYHWNQSSDLLIHVWPHLTAIIGTSVTSHLICRSMFGRTSRLSLERVIWFVDPCLDAPHDYHWNESSDLLIHVWPHLTATIGTSHMICRSMFGRTSRLSLERII